MNCPLCKRELGDENIDRHHLIPKSRKGKVQEPIHRVCHRFIHATFTEKELEKKFHTWESLREVESVKTFIEWIKNKPINFYIGSKDSSSRKR